jgi:uncharacterized protein YndB with AHSA1/START domain
MKRKTQPIQIYVSSVLGAPIEQVWSLLRDFDGLPRWHPAIAKSRIEAGRDAAAVGCVRALTLKSGEGVREQLLELSDEHKRVIYNILDSDVGLLNYVSVMTLFPVTDRNETFVSWSADFTTIAGLEAEKARMVEKDVFQAGLHALNAVLVREQANPN